MLLGARGAVKMIKVRGVKVFLRVLEKVILKELMPVVFVSYLAKNDPEFGDIFESDRKMVEKLGPSPPHSEMQSCVAVRVGDVAVHMVTVLRVGE